MNARIWYTLIHIQLYLDWGVILVTILSKDTDFSACEKTGLQRCVIFSAILQGFARILKINTPLKRPWYSHTCTAVGRVHLRRTCAQVAQFTMQALLKVTIDFMQNAKRGHLINTTIFAKFSFIKNISQVVPHSWKKDAGTYVFLMSWKLSSTSLTPSSSPTSSWSLGLAIQPPKIPCKSSYLSSVLSYHCCSSCSSMNSRSQQLCI